MAQYKLHYLPFYGRREASIFMLDHAGVDYELATYQLGPEWMAVKPTMPNGQCPALELNDGTMMGEGYSISRYLGSVHGYYPTDPMEAYEVDCMLDGYEDILGKLVKPAFTPENEREALYDGIFNKEKGTLTKFLRVCEPMCAKGEWLCGPKLTVADFWIGGMYTNLINNEHCFGREHWDACLDEFPAFKAYGQKFAAEVKKRLESRPPAII